MTDFNDYNSRKGVTIDTLDGEAIDFDEVLSLVIDEEVYVLLQPTKTSADIASDEAIVCKVSNGDEYEITEDEEIIEKVFREYEKLFDEKDEA